MTNKTTAPMTPEMLAMIREAVLADERDISYVDLLLAEVERLQNENAIEAARAEKYRVILAKYFGVSDLLAAGIAARDERITDDTNAD